MLSKPAFITVYSDISDSMSTTHQSSTHLSVSSEMKWHMDWRFFLWSHANKRTNEQTNWTKSCWNCSWRVIATSFVDSSRTSDVYIVTSRSSFSSVPNYWYHQLAGNTGWEIGDLATGCSNSKNWVRPPESEERERKAAAINWGLWPMLNKLASSNFSLECTLPVLHAECAHCQWFQNCRQFQPQRVVSSDVKL